MMITCSANRDARPLVAIINDVEVLSEGEYNLQREEKGVYKQV